MSLYEPETGEDLRTAIEELNKDYFARFNLGWNISAAKAVEDVALLAFDQRRRSLFTSESDMCSLLAVDLRTSEGIEQDAIFRECVQELGFLALWENIESVPVKRSTDKGKEFEDVDAFSHATDKDTVFIRERRIMLPREDLMLCGKLYALSSSRYVKS